MGCRTEIDRIVNLFLPFSDNLFGELTFRVLVFEVLFSRCAIIESCASGFGYMDIETSHTPSMSENLNSRNEAVVHAELDAI